MRYGREILLATILLCMSMIAAYRLLYHLPLEREILQLGLERQQTAQQIINVLNFKNEYGSLDEYMRELEERRFVVDRALPPQLEQGEFINYIQRTALANQVRLISLTPGAVENVEDDALPILRLPLRLKIECDYFKLLDFLKALEDGERFINIEQFDVSRKDDGELLDCELDVILFAIKESE